MDYTELNLTVISNPPDLVNDLERQSTDELTVKVIIQLI